jgi:hypothetical protein
MSALPPKADKQQISRRVRFVLSAQSVDATQARPVQIAAGEVEDVQQIDRRVAASVEGAVHGAGNAALICRLPRPLRCRSELKQRAGAGIAQARLEIRRQAGGAKTVECPNDPAACR